MVVTLDSIDDGVGCLYVRQIQTNPNHMRQGHAISLVRAIFQKAAQNSLSIQFTPFEGNGKKLAKQIAVTHHQEFPTVQVHYSGQTEPITGGREYRMKFGRFYFITQKTGIEYI